MKPRKTRIWLRLGTIPFHGLNFVRKSLPLVLNLFIGFQTLACRCPKKLKVGH